MTSVLLKPLTVIFGTFLNFLLSRIFTPVLYHFLQPQPIHWDHVARPNPSLYIGSGYMRLTATHKQLC